VEEWLQQGFGVRFDWGPEGARRLAPGSAYAVVVDVLSFTTSVSVLADRGTRVYPAPWGERLDGPPDTPVAVGRRAVTPAAPWSLSPAALRRAPRTPRLVLPSPNGSAIVASLARRRGDAAAIQDHCGLVAASLRNAGAVGRWLRASGLGTVERPVTVIAAGERWPDGSLRPAVEDLLGAGAVIDALGAAALSPEAATAAHAFRAQADLTKTIVDSASGRELTASGFADDVAIAVEHDASGVVPVLRDGAFSPVRPGSGVD
jgi:2-phosphosulfolactate phosphatase